MTVVEKIIDLVDRRRMLRWHDSRPIERRQPEIDRITDKLGLIKTTSPTSWKEAGRRLHG